MYNSIASNFKKYSKPGVNSNKENKTLKTVLSDVDGTIVRGSLVLRHAAELHRTGMYNLGRLPELWEADQKNEVLIKDLAEAYRAAITGKRIDELNVSEFVDEICKDEKNFHSPLQRLIKQKSDGYNVTLVSGSPSYLVKAFGDRYGFKTEASRYHVDADNRLTGDVDGMFNADSKRRYVSSLNLLSKANVYAFGDTSSDVPLFEAASYSVLVAPTDETRLSIGLSVNEIVED